MNCVNLDVSRNFMRDTLTKQEVEDFLRSFRILIQELMNCTFNVEKIVEENEKNYQQISFIRPFLNHYVNLCYSQSVITISKLFAENEKTSFKKLINKFENFTYDDELKAVLNENKEKFEKGHVGEYDYLFKNKQEIKDEISRILIEILKIEAILNKIKSRRDSYYAHFDPSKQNEIEVETLSDLKVCLELAQEIFNKFFGSLMNTTFIFNICGIDKLIDLAKESYMRSMES